MGRSWESKYKDREKRKADRKAEKKKDLVNKIDKAMGIEYYDLAGMTWGQKIGLMLSASWIINRWYEKIILSVLVFLGIWKILNFFGVF